MSQFYAVQAAAPGSNAIKVTTYNLEDSGTTWTKATDVKLVRFLLWGGGGGGRSGRCGVSNGAGGGTGGSGGGFVDITYNGADVLSSPYTVTIGTGGNGGGGAGNLNANASGAGGNGAAGRVIIIEYF